MDLVSYLTERCVRQKFATSEGQMFSVSGYILCER
jgi:hypothetical protein